MAMKALVLCGLFCLFFGQVMSTLSETADDCGGEWLVTRHTGDLPYLAKCPTGKISRMEATVYADGAECRDFERATAKACNGNAECSIGSPSGCSGDMEVAFLCDPAAC
ncbi:uncharacterized protein LOC143288063 [Babylonia areolata]|uniref:uncharacterized protein LOC143288063 n=1 Tax=Babylonia areolata TaxID=304850 RepID=UPI003FD4BB61